MANADYYGRVEAGQGGHRNHSRRRDDDWDRDRDYSPDYYSGGGRGDRDRDRDVSPARTNDSFRRETMQLEPIRNRSQPPPDLIRRRSRSISRYSRSSSQSSSSSRDRSRGRHSNHDLKERSSSAIGRARSAAREHFTTSPAGIGAGLLGAVVGGLVAKEASDVATRHRHKGSRGGHNSREEHQDHQIQMISAVLGAVAGGLGANALANKVEDKRDRNRSRQHAWEQRHGREQDLPHYDTGRSRDLDHRNGHGLRDADSDDDYDFVYDDVKRIDDRRSRRGS